MATKLTLALDESIVRKAKKYARERNVSISKLVEFYFTSLVSDSTDASSTLPPITAELSGMIRSSTSRNAKKLLTDALAEKYL